MHIKKILNFSYVFWIGDLNFGLNGDLLTENIERFLRKNELDELLKYDQLSSVMKYGQAFSEFYEGKITFPPTFKYHIGTQDFNKK